jgi:UDPglucose--hexose-1-phosphate uridylyltransferase
MIYTNIEELLAYGLKNKLIAGEDAIWARNTLLGLLGLPDNKNTPRYGGPVPKNPSDILSDISFYAAENNLLPADTATYREIFETAIMSVLTARPSDIIKKFFDTAKTKGIKKATSDFYKYCQKVYYVKTDRVAKNINWKAKTGFGRLDMTINLSKPEKDPKEIALRGKLPPNGNGYPKCLLCKENEGYAGRLNHPARQNLRLIPLKLGGDKWFFQYSPYVYYNEHSIVFSAEHKPMKISKKTFANLLDFVEMFPHYFIGSNADLPIVGGSILDHDHYQAGRYVFPMERVPSVKSFKVKKCPGVSFDIIRWPLSVLRLRGGKKEVAKAGAYVFEKWRKYEDKKAGVLHSSGGVQHNTVTPIARFKDGKYELDIVLRNNRASKEHPWGIFHSRPQYHNIKRENIGLIEVLGMAILPGRLKTEMTQVAALIGKGETEKIKNLSSTAQHYNWVKSFIGEYEKEGFAPGDVMDILLGEIGLTFTKVLYNCGVFKHDGPGKEAFLRFINKL